MTPQNEQSYKKLFNGRLRCWRSVFDQDPLCILSLLPLENLSNVSLSLPEDISACQYLDITINVQSFFAVRQDKCHFLLATKSMIACRMKFMTLSIYDKQGLETLLSKWDEQINPVAVISRYSDREITPMWEYSLIDKYLTVSVKPTYEKLGMTTWDKSIENVTLGFRFKAKRPANDYPK